MTSAKSLAHIWNIMAALVAGALVVTALIGLASDRERLIIEAVTIDGTPATTFRKGATPAPVVVIAHGFAGSQQLMQAFGLNAARNGMIAVSFDFLGHGGNPEPLGGSVTEIAGATRSLTGQTARMVRYAREIGDGRVALLGHSMASDVIIRVAEADPAIAATVAISAFSRVVTAQTPRNLLLIAGAWEGYLSAEALKLVGQVSGPSPEPGVTYGSFNDGNARRFVSAPNVEHVGVLYSATSLAEAQAWLSNVFGLPEPAAPVRSGLWISLLLAGLILAVKPLAALLPVVSTPAIGGGMGWRHLWLVALLPAIATPLLLRVLPTHFLPILVADYLALHFLLYGALTFATLRLTGGSTTLVSALLAARLPVAVIGAILISFGGLFLAIDTFVTAIAPIPQRLILIAVLFAGTLGHFTATEWAMRGAKAARGAAFVLPAAFLVSLALAVALDLKRLFFLAIIVPVIVPLLIVFGLFGHWIYARTGHPAVAAIAHAVAFALVIGATFPMLTG